ncbi:uncharacterized protein Z520_06951 [Fonsecaea multimorphosa CBS 102226]|uniref:Enoyl reductase (ER) domain-containing protein n=1 Tax=Fonsecaea multimorphosa CBS 102226 TaxID=1442371 RepID=A0A0D2K319_9EURO|nr:uncharacterized protein Z520_06951 [Fonsecaea multimorphosa CBS 102226]KIX97499.1 hypothetical protein Z520_06951 [Fonsecaea multimorphosa CBS 102226]OAL23461.1 hypothetical protein AYO22_06511 [Fonsecaea multimorphosa]
MATTKAIVVLPGEKAAGIREVPMPRIRDDWILVKTKAVALNPTDWKHIDFAYANAGSRIGCDYAGVVEEVGSKVTTFKKGDRVAGFTHGGHRIDHETGAFGEHILAKACVQIKIPDHLDFERAASMPVSMYTCGLGLYKALQLPLPSEPANEPFPLLIHGGSTASGIWGIQFAKASGLTAVTTASPRNFDYLKSLGADAVFGYHSPTCGADIRAFTKNKLRYAWDCVGGGEIICGEALSTVKPSKYGGISAVPTNIELLNKTNPLVEGHFFTVTYNILGEPYEWQNTIVPPAIDDMEFAIMFKEIALGLIEKGSLKFIRLDLNHGGSGLEGVMKGLDEMRKGRVSGHKLVYTM